MVSENIAGILHKKIARVCPITGVSLGDYNDKQTWAITYAEGATQDQQNAAQAILSAETYSSLQKQLYEPTEQQKENISDLDFRPKNVLFYYGYPNSFNSLINGWYNEKVAQDMAGYDIVVLGDGVENPTHPDYANTQIILPRVKEINPQVILFGYVACAQTLNDFQTKVDQWDTLQAKGIFIDEAGYDFGTNRVDFNTRIDYVHGKTSANVCFVNAWNPDHIIGLVNDVSYPNSTWNPDSVNSSLLISDWILAESFPVNTTAYSGNNGYESLSDWLARAQKIIGVRGSFGVNIAALNTINDDNENGQALFNFAYVSSLMWAFEAFGTSNTNYGASTAQVKYWTRPDTAGIRKLFEVEPVVKQDSSDSDVYCRFADKGKLTIDFSSGAQSSSITKR